MLAFLHRLTSPKYFYDFSGKLLPWLVGLVVILFGYGVIASLFLAPADYQQGEAFRMIYIHVPSAFLSMMVYMTMAVATTIYFVWQIKIADVIAKASAPIGAWFTALALITGSLWGRPMWGTWWIWDARLTSELILLFLYLGIIALRRAIPEPLVAARASGILALVGVVNIPIIHYSVYWWNTLHQGATISKFERPAIAPAMLYPLIAMIVAFVIYYAIALLLRARCDILTRERKTRWVNDLLMKTR